MVASPCYLVDFVVYWRCVIVWCPRHCLIRICCWIWFCCKWAFFSIMQIYRLVISLVLLTKHTIVLFSLKIEFLNFTFNYYLLRLNKFVLNEQAIETLPYFSNAPCSWEYFKAWLGNWCKYIYACEQITKLLGATFLSSFVLLLHHMYLFSLFATPL